MPDRYIGQRQRQRRGGLLFLIILLIVLLFCSRYIASTLIDYSWWSELGQVDTWINLLIYGTGPILLAIIVFFVAFWIAFKLGMRHSAVEGPVFGVFRRSFVSRLAFVVLALFAIGIANATVDSWTVVKYFGGLRVPRSAAEFSDPIFGKSLHFYFFGLPFYSMLLRVVLVGAVLALIIYWVAAHAENFSKRLPGMYSGSTFDFQQISIREAFDSTFVRSVAAILLVGLAIKFYFNRFDFLLQDHGQYLVGVDWVADHIVLPLQWLLILASILAAILVLAKRGKLALVLLLVLPVRYIVPSLVAGLYVRPNELALERPYIQHHIEATRSAYGLNQRVKETTLEAAPEIPIDYAKHKPLLDNVRLWDWRAFHDTISQIQPLRPYVYIDTDVDRYQIDGQLRQVLISPRELDIRQLGAAASRWINPHLMYTHGYGIVMAESNRITPDGLPVLFIKDAPPVVTTKSLRFTQPEIYYSEVAHEPVFVDTGQQEFNYPSGSQSVYTSYSGTGGFPISSFGMRLGRDCRVRRRQHSADRIPDGAQPHDDSPAHPRAAFYIGGLSRLGFRSLPRPDRFRPPRVDGGRIYGFRSPPLLARDESLKRGIAQLHSQFDQSDDRRLHGRDQSLRVRSGRCVDSGVLAIIPLAVQAGIGHAGGSAGARALSGDVVQRASGDLSHIPYARSRSVLQSRRLVGSCPHRYAPNRRRGLRLAHLCRCDSAGQRHAGIHASDDVYAGE